MSWLALIPAITQTLMSGVQLTKGMMDAQTQRPAFDIPEEVYQNKDLAETAYRGQLGAVTSAQDQINKAQSNTVDQMLKAGGTPSDIAKTQGMANNATTNLASMSENVKQNQLQTYMQSLDMLSQWKNQKNQWDTRDDYLATMGEASANIGAGLQNIYGASTSVADYFQSKDYMKYMSELYGIGDEAKKQTPSIENMNNMSNVGLPDLGIGSFGFGIK